MAQFSLPNTQTGGSQTITANSLQDAMNQAQSQGTWNPGAGTYGANSIIGGGGTPTGLTSTGGVDMSGLSSFAAQTSGVTQKQLDQQKAEFDAQLQFAKDQMQQLGIPQLQINQMLANMQQQQFQSGLVLAQQNQQFNQAATQAALTGWYTPPAAVPSVQQWLGGAGTSIGGGAGTPTAGTTSRPADGTFVKDAGGAEVGVMQGGVLQPFPTWQAYIAAGGNPDLSKISSMPTAQYQALKTAGSTGATGTPGAAPTPVSGFTPGSYLRDPNTGAIYLVDASGKPSWITNPADIAPGATSTSVSGLTDWLSNQTANQPQQTEAAREFNANLGQQYLATAAQLQGPQNTFQLSNYLRGAQANPNVPVYLQNLAQGVGQNLFVAPGQNAPTTQSAAGLVGQLGGGQSATPGWDYNQTLGTIQNIMGAGAQKLGPGALENLTPDELQALGSGIGAAGGTLPSFLQQYAQSRIGQAAPVAQSALA